jgi:hypothetical protein
VRFSTSAVALQLTIEHPGGVHFRFIFFQVLCVHGLCSFQAIRKNNWKAALYRHSLQGVHILRPAVTTYSVRLTVHREDTTEVSVVTSKEEVVNGYEACHKRSFAALALLASTLASVKRVASRSIRKISEQAELLSMELDSILILQVTSHFERVPKLLVLLAIPHSAHGLS